MTYEIVTSQKCYLCCCIPQLMMPSASGQFLINPKYCVDVWCSGSGVLQGEDGNNQNRGTVQSLHKLLCGDFNDVLHGEHNKYSHLHNLQVCWKMDGSLTLLADELKLRVFPVTSGHKARRRHLRLPTGNRKVAA